MGFREEKDSNLIKLLVEETYSRSLGNSFDDGLDSYFETAKESNYIDSFLLSRGVSFYSGENYDQFYRINIAEKAIDLPKNISSFSNNNIGFVGISKNEDQDYLINALTSLDPAITNSQSMIIYFNGKQSRTIFFDNQKDYDETVEYLTRLSGQTDHIDIAA